MGQKNKPKGYWNKEKCIEEANKYNTKKDFIKNSIGAVLYAKKHGIYNDITSHMISKYKPHGYWTIDKCIMEALKYTNKKDFQKKSARAYIILYNNNLLNEYCSHMIVNENNKRRCIYAYEFSDNHVYVGLTFDINDRHNRHMREGTVFNYIKKNEKYKFIQLTDYLQQQIAQKEENFYVEQYKKLGWILLNKTKTGSLGSYIISWTKEKCIEESLKYNKRSDFQIHSKGAYLRAYKNNWLDEICAHMIEGKRPNGFWNYDNCKKYAAMCKNVSEFSVKFAGGYDSAMSNKWLKEFFNKKI